MSARDRASVFLALLSLSCSVEMRRGCLFLLVVITVLQLVSTGKPFVMRNIHGIVGGGVNMRCELERPRNIYGLYFQKTPADGNEDNDIFINGFHPKNIIVPPEYINRTNVNKTDFSMELFNLSLADEGVYSCIVLSDTDNYIDTKFNLTVTANFSVPNITVQGCNSVPSAHNCVIECSSSGGYPLSNVTWDVVGDKTSSLLMDKGDPPVFKQDADSRLWTVSHNVTLDCSQPLNITCSVGGVMSPIVSVCPPPPKDFTIPFACVILLLVPIAVIVIVVIRCRRTQPSERSTDAELANLKSGWMNTEKHTLSENLN
ncbi:T-lymphocyte activation antigen CD80-like isoform X2 [Neoarius graeffei]|uniref:T-lymphocyte activation antigen CD80-like isoform X2 n=2 Tax=Neoarius graeffei TaxID=443677 RepID=UPI00298C4E54|nr:T-lymphocyte activation antigen CD80-like isoform X2 [Neoarius graeffei]